MITLTGNRSILPLACAWAPSEKGDYTDMFLDLLHDELYRIKSCHTDESGALIGSIEKKGIKNLLCYFHMSQHCPDVKELKSLIMSQTSNEYETKKHSIIVNNVNLKKYLDTNNKWQKISRFETGVPRDQNIFHLQWNHLILQLKD